MLKIIILLLLCLCVAGSGTPGKEGTVEEGSLVEGSLLEAGEATPFYIRTEADGRQTARMRMPLAWSKVFFFGVKAGGPSARVALYNDHLATLIENSVDIQFGVVPNEVEIYLKGIHQWETRVSKHRVILSDKHFTWFTVAMMNDKIALYDETHAKPILLYRCKPISECNFNQYGEYKLSSPGNWALWDVAGWTYTGALARWRRDSELEPVLKHEAEVLLSRYAEHRLWSATHMVLYQYHEQHITWDYPKMFNISQTLLPIRSTVRFFGLEIPAPKAEDLDKFVGRETDYKSTTVRIMDYLGSKLCDALTTEYAVKTSFPTSVHKDPNQPLPLGWVMVYSPLLKEFRVMHVEDVRRVRSASSPRDYTGFERP